MLNREKLGAPNVSRRRGREWRIWTGISSSAVAQAIAAGHVVLLVPFFLRAWGVDGYGHWLTLTALVSYLSLLDLGAQNYIGNLLAIDHARGQRASFRTTLSEGVSLFLGIGLAAAIVLGILSYLAVTVTLPGLSRPLGSSEAWILTFLGIHLVMVSVPGGVYVTAYRATGLFARGAMVGNAVRVISVGVSAGLLWLSITPRAYALSVLTTGLVLTLVIILDTRRCIPGCRGLDVSLRSARKGVVHLHGSMYFWLLALAQAAKQQGILLVLASAASPSVVALYATHRTIACIPSYLPTVILGPLMPEFTFLWARDRIDDLSRATIVGIRVVLITTGTAAVLLWLLSPLTYGVWTSGRIGLEPTLLAFLLVQGVLSSGWATSTWSLLAANRHRSTALWSLTNAAVTVLLAGLIVAQYGAIGVALASLVGDIVCGLVVFPFLASSFIRVKASKLYAEIGSGALVLMMLLVCARFVGEVLSPWMSVLALAFLGAVVVLGALMTARPVAQPSKAAI